MKTLKRNVSRTNRVVKLVDSYEEFIHIYRILVRYELDKIEKDCDIENKPLPLCVREGSCTMTLKWTKWRNTILNSIVKTP